MSANQTWVDQVIIINNSAQYDIGHVFSTGGGGVAKLASTCDPTYKAYGVTGLTNPTGDMFYIDFVAHEIGHQFGAEHTFNGTTFGCSGNRSDLNAYEPGSGSTIMAYAGLCGSENIQLNSDATFHSKSIEQMNSFIAGAGSCSLTTVSASNLSEPVASAGPDRVIPTGTPFLLQGIGTDADIGDTLSYQWDQIDTGTETTSTTLGDDLGDNALIRTYLPQATGNRDIPALGTQVVDGPYDLSEALPCTARDLNFRLTVRDGKSGQDTDDLKLTVDANSGPFRVTSHTTASSILESDLKALVTWDVANTDNALVNCQNVDIDLLTFSTDHSTYSVHNLVTNTPNDGGYPVLISGDTNAQARFRVKCNDNIFYDISDADLNFVGSGAPYDTSQFNTFFNSANQAILAAATCSGAPAIGSGGGGSFANFGANASIVDTLWLISLFSLLLGTSLKRARFKRIRPEASLRPE